MLYEAVKFSERLKRVREDKGLTMPQLADNLGISKQAINGFEKGTSNPSLDILCKLANLFDISVDYLLGRSNNPQFGISTTEKALKYGLCDNSCGFDIETLTPQDDVYCPKCGAKINYQCSDCGRLFKFKNQSYCMGCGKLLQTPGSAEDW